MSENGNGNGRYKAQEFIDAIEGSAGIITTIATRVNCAWHTAKKYITNYPTIARAYDDECERVKDLAESVVIKAMNAEDVQTAKWYLTLKAKDRGYVQQTDVTTKGESLNEGRLSDAQRANLVAALLERAGDPAGGSGTDE